MASSVQEYIDRNNLQKKVHQRRRAGLGVQQLEWFPGARVTMPVRPCPRSRTC